MKKSTLMVIIFLFGLVLLLGYNYFARPFAKEVAPELPQVEEEIAPAPTLSQEEVLWQSMTSRQRVTQMIALPVNVSAAESSSAAETSWIATNQPGFITIFGQKVSRLAAQSVISNLINVPTTIDILVGVDHEGGTVQRLAGDGFTVLPDWKKICQDFDSDQTGTESLLRASAREIKNVGIDLVFAPVVDVGQSRVLKSRLCSDNPEQVISVASQLIDIYQAEGILPVIKHFPGLGSVDKDLHQAFTSVTIEDKDAEVYRQLLSQFPQIGVMVSHAGVKNQYPDIPCSLSSSCLEQLSSLFPEALVFSDALDMKAAAYDVRNPKQEKSLSLISSEAVFAGNEVLVFGPSVSLSELNEVVARLEARYQNEADFAAKVDQSVQKILKYKKTLNKLEE